MTWVEGEDLLRPFEPESQAAAFLAGAKFWEFHRTGFTMWTSDAHLVKKEALKRYPILADTEDE